jgi:hypothetical protein
MGAPLAMAHEPHGKRLIASLVWGVTVILAVWAMAFAFLIRQYCVDDAFIGFQCVRNFLGGAGFVFCPGDAPVEAVTNIGWLMVLTPFCVFFEPVVVAKLGGLALVLLVLVLTVRLSRGLGAKGVRPQDSLPWTVVPALLLATRFDFLYFSLAGMETALLAAILVFMACVVLSRPHSLILPVLGAFAFSVHPEAVTAYAFYAALRWIQAKDDRRWFVTGMVILCTLVGAMTAIRFEYFHDIVPNTFHAKPSDPKAFAANVYVFLTGGLQNIPFPLTGWLVLPVLLLGYCRLRRAASAPADMLAAICGTGLLFATYSPPDWTTMARYFAPYLPVTLILLWAGLVEAVGSMRDVPFASRPRTRLAFALLAVGMLVGMNVYNCRRRLARMDEYPGYVLGGKNLVGPSLWIRDNLPRTTTIATRRIGALAYYSDHKVFDYAYGLPDRDVAQLVARHGQSVDTLTDPAFAAVWQARAPDYLLEDGPMIEQIVSHAKGTRDRFSVHGIYYRAVKGFPIGSETQWVLAQRIRP